MLTWIQLVHLQVWKSKKYFFIIVIMIMNDDSDFVACSLLQQVIFIGHFPKRTPFLADVVILQSLLLFCTVLSLEDVQLV